MSEQRKSAHEQRYAAVTCQHCRTIVPLVPDGEGDPAPGVCERCLAVRMNGLVLAATFRLVEGTPPDDVRVWLHEQLVDVGMLPEYAQAFVEGAVPKGTPP